MRIRVTVLPAVGLVASIAIREIIPALSVTAISRRLATIPTSSMTTVRASVDVAATSTGIADVRAARDDPAPALMILTDSSQAGAASATAASDPSKRTIRRTGTTEASGRIIYSM